MASGEEGASNMTLTGAIRTLKADFEGRSCTSQLEQSRHDEAVRVKHAATPEQVASARAQVAQEDQWDFHYPEDYAIAMRQIGRHDLAKPIEDQIAADNKLMLDGLPDQPEEGQYTPDEIRAMVEEQLEDDEAEESAAS
jgi:hypothetical protein